MDYESFFRTQLDGLHAEGRYRVFADPERHVGDFLTWYDHSAFRIDAGAAKILIDPFLSDNPSWEKEWIGCRAGEDSTQGGAR